MKLTGNRRLRLGPGGQLTIPKRWRDTLGDDLLLLAVGDHLELWPVATLDKMISELPSFGEPPPGIFEDFKL